jgi:N-acetylglucosamine-6-phosphate deacetylase
VPSLAKEKTREQVGGSATPQLEMIRNYVNWGFGMIMPLKMSTLVPARIIGETKKGLLRVGNDADLILIDDRSSLHATVIKGAIVYTANTGLETVWPSAAALT